MGLHGLEPANGEPGAGRDPTCRAPGSLHQSGDGDHLDDRAPGGLDALSERKTADGGHVRPQCGVSDRREPAGGRHASTSDAHLMGGPAGVGSGGHQTTPATSSATTGGGEAIGLAILKLRFRNPNQQCYFNSAVYACLYWLRSKLAQVGTNKLLQGLKKLQGLDFMVAVGAPGAEPANGTGAADAMADDRPVVSDLAEAIAVGLSSMLDGLGDSLPDAQALDEAADLLESASIAENVAFPSLMEEVLLVLGHHAYPLPVLQELQRHWTQIAQMIAAKAAGSAGGSAVGRAPKKQLPRPRHKRGVPSGEEGSTSGAGVLRLVCERQVPRLGHDRQPKDRRHRDRWALGRLVDRPRRRRWGQQQRAWGLVFRRGPSALRRPIRRVRLEYMSRWFKSRGMPVH